jgi:hypothetical protein
MAIVRVDRTVQTAQGQAISGAFFYVLTQPANTTALTPLANVYSDLSGTAAPNPQITDGLGQVGFYLDNTQLYTFVVVSPLLKTQTYPDQSLGSSSSGVTYTPVSGAPAGAIDGVNRVYTLPSVPVAGTLLWQWNGQLLTNGLGYTLSGATVTMALAPAIGDSVYANYFR